MSNNNDWINGLFSGSDSDAREERLRTERKIDALLPSFCATLWREIGDAVQAFNNKANAANRRELNITTREPGGGRLVLKVQARERIVAIDAHGRFVTSMEGFGLAENFNIAMESDGTLGLKRPDGAWVVRGEMAKELIEPFLRDVLSGS